MNKKQINRYAFTLVELIISIIILVILSTISFIWYSGYLRDARDAERVATLTSMSEILDIIFSEDWFYPEPDNAIDVKYEWQLLWQQWTFWENVYDSIWRKKFERKPEDPLTWDDYAYSITNLWDRYELSSIKEVNKDLVSIVPTTYAESLDYISIVFWNYNKKMLATNVTTTNWTWYVLAIPSILSSDLLSINVLDTIVNKYFVYPNYYNHPYSFSWELVNLNWGFDFLPNKIILYSWSIDDLKTTQSYRISLLKNLQDSYSGTIISSTLWDIEDIEIDTLNPSDQVKELSDFVVRKYLNKAIID